MNLSLEIGYYNYAVCLLLLSGVFVIRVDAAGYRLLHMNRETKAANILGWTNIVLGCTLLLLQLAIHPG